MKGKRDLINWLGFLGVASFISYLLAVVLSPLAYPGYDWMRQAVSDLSAADAPSKALWNQLSSAYHICGIVCVTLVCVYVQNRLSKALRAGIYLFALMNWVSGIGYSMFPLTTGGYAGTVQDVMHVAVTAAVVLLSIVSLVFIIAGGLRKKQFRSLAIFAAISLALMFAGSVGVGVVPRAYFGVVERLSVFSATGFTAILGLYLFSGFDKREQNGKAE
ncbi:MAG: DUF998 domain-containing protein [Oscillospiraceae bacterium]|jgi:hypothetical membrane protein|nr:DUF998 domain-containing protein [Oscillospiraceae bacterium]